VYAFSIGNIVKVASQRRFVEIIECSKGQYKLQAVSGAWAVAMGVRS
jgi:hypothetical protein